MSRTRPRKDINWYLPEWMDHLGVKQSDMMEKTGWNKTTMSLLYNRKQDYKTALVKEAALALNLEPFELLMRPEEAMAYRQMRSSSIRIAASTPEIELKATGTCGD